jgi:hypothetical protein
MPTREIIYTGNESSEFEEKPNLFLIILISWLCATVALAVLWWSFSSPPRAPVRAAPPQYHSS